MTPTLAEEMVQYRARHKLSQTKFGELCGVNVMTINFVERGIQKPSALTTAKIRMVLDAEKEGKA